jgi:arabinan endo-1,5-alpha-L-arabinosidase
MKLGLRSWLAIALAAVGIETAPAAETNDSAQAEAILIQSGRRDAAVHDPSTIVKCKDEYWLFATGRGIPSWHSVDMTNWTRGPLVFTNRPPWTADAVPANRSLYYWAPDIVRVEDRYLLYYSVSTFGENTSAIGIVGNPTLDPADPAFRWTDLGLVVQSTNQDNFNAIDPAVCRDAKGGLWLSFGSFWSGIKLIELNPATGKRMAPDSPMYSLASNSSIEASYIYPHAGQYYLFVNWGVCCRGVRSTYNIRVGRSREITGAYLDRDGVEMTLGGGSLLLGTTGPFIGPGHAGIIGANGREWLSCHFYDGTRRGASTLAIRPLHWAADGWPEVDAPNSK